MATTTPATLGTDARDERVAGGASPLELLLAPTLLPEIAHVFGLSVVVALCWQRMPTALLAGWAIAVLGTTLTRAQVRRYARTLEPAQALRLVRLTVAGQALAWGLGAAVAAPDLEFRFVALLLVLFAGLVAGALTTLTADVPAGRLFVTGLLVPLGVGVLVNGTDREHLLGVLMLAVFGAFILAQMARANRTLLAFERAHAMLRDSEGAAVRERRYLDGLFESAPVAISIVDAAGRVARVNPAFQQLFGYAAPEAVGALLDDLIVPPAGRSTGRALHERASSGGAVRAEVDRIRKDGSAVPVRLLAARVEGVGTGELFVLYEDVTARRRAAEAVNRLAAIVESSDDAIYSQTTDGTVISWNAGAERLYGYSAADMVGRSGLVITPPDRLDELNDLHDRLHRGVRCPPFETERVRRDGVRIPISLAASAIRNADGDVIGISKVARDVTRELAARQALQDARLAAERAAQARTTFLANMSHEIRTPMNAILGFSELLLDSELSAEQRHSLTLVQSSAQTLLTLIDDILDFSKIEAEHVQLESIAYDLRNLVESTTGLLSIRARERRLELLAHVAPEVPRKVRGDPTRLRQVLTNLVGNALKFTHEGEVVVSAAVTDTSADRVQIRFSVRDTGIGIAADKLETIFQEFSQADASMTRRYGGTGLGLTIARKLVRLMGGELTVGSEVGSGTEFAFTLPMDVEHVDDAAVLPAGAAYMAGRRTLIVDDNATNRRIVRDMLAGAGMPITEAEAGDQALDILRRAHAENQAFDFVILDAQMPGLDGFALAAAVRADAALADTRLLMLTSAGQRGDGQRCRELGIQGYLGKPASRTDLLEAVAAVLAGGTAGAAAPEVVTRHTIAESRPRLQILLAEDNVVNQEVAATVLRKRGHHVDVVGDGRAATTAVAEKRYDVILMDIQMPVMDGFEATRAIRATDAGRDIPIVALTAHAQRGEREACLAQGMTDFLTKPFKSHELYAVVEGRGATVAHGEVAAATPAGRPAVDIEAFRREMRDAGAEEAVEAILGTFRSTAPGRLQDLENAVASGEADAIRRAAHAYKSAAATIGARELARLLGEMEEAARGGTVDGAPQTLQQTRVAHAAAVDQVARAIPNT